MITAATLAQQLLANPNNTVQAKDLVNIIQYLSNVESPYLLLSGTIAPTSDIGFDGQFYLNRTTGIMYYKSGGAWTVTTTIMDGAVYDPAALAKQLTSTTIQHTVAEMQALALASGFIVNQLYQITNADAVNDVVINIVAISTSALAPFGYGTFKNANMGVAVNAVMGYNLSSDKTLYVQEPIRNNTVVAISVTDGVDTFQFDNVGWYNNTWLNITISGVDASAIFRKSTLGNCTIVGGSFTGLIFTDYISTVGGVTITVPANNTTYGFNQSFSRIIARKTAIDGATLGTTKLTFEGGVDLSNYIPTHAVVKYNSGTLGICVVRLLADATVIAANLALVTVTSSANALMPCIPLAGITNDSSKSLYADITTASLAASTFNIIVYGVPLS